MSKNNTKTSNLWDIIKDLKAPVIPKPEFPVIEIENMDELEAKFAEEAEIRKLQLQALRQQNDLKSTKISYNSKIFQLTLLGKVIAIPANTNEESLCRVLFNSKSAMERVWSWDEVVEKWGDDIDTRNWRDVYDAGRRINTKIAGETTIKNALIVKKKTVQINPQYLQK